MVNIPVLNLVALCVDQDGKSKPGKIKGQEFLFVLKKAHWGRCGKLSCPWRRASSFISFTKSFLISSGRSDGS